MTYRSRIALAAVVVAAATSGPARAAAPTWTSPQDLGATGGGYRLDNAIASNDRGDAVVVLFRSNGIFVARARANEEFSAPRRIASSGFSPTVAIDERGVALVAFYYFDEQHVASDLRDDDCCTGVKVSVWQPGHRPTRPRAVRARGVATELGAIAATRRHRGVLIAGEEFSDDADDPVRLASVRIDGRVRLRRVADSAWSPLTLQWAGGRAIAGLVRLGSRRGTELAVARQRRSLRFGAPRRFARVSVQRDPGEGDLVMSADGRGGQLAAYERGTRPNFRLVLSRKPLDGRVRTSIVQRGRGLATTIAPPVRARDGWIAVATARRGAPGEGDTAYVTTRSPAGRLATTAVSDPVTLVDALAVSVAPGGAGAVGLGTLVGLAGSRASVVALAGGRPQPAGVLDIGPTAFGSNSIVLTANASDPARAAFERGGRAFAARLQAPG